MALLRVHLKGRDPVDVECSKYEVNVVTEGSGTHHELYLVLTGDEDKEIGKFRQSEVVGYHWR